MPSKSANPSTARRGDLQALAIGIALCAVVASSAIVSVSS